MKMTKSLNLMLAYWFERSGFVTRRISTGSNLAGGSLLHRDCEQALHNIWEVSIFCRMVLYILGPYWRGAIHQIQLYCYCIQWNLWGQPFCSGFCFQCIVVCNFFHVQWCADAALECCRHRNSSTPKTLNQQRLQHIKQNMLHGRHRTGSVLAS